MKKWKSKLFPVITLAVCLGLAACGGGAESEGSSDDQEDYEETENSAPESFEGMVIRISRQFMTCTGVPGSAKMTAN